VEFFYTVENTGDTDHDVGVRIMFDTQLGSNDSAPFKLPVIGDVTTETELSGHDISEFWQAFDSLTNPNIIAQGTLKLDKSSTPDRVRFTNWGSARSNPWDYTKSAGSRNGDSAVCLYWNEESLAKDDVLSCKTFYGLSALQEDLRPPLAVALSAATKLGVVEDSDGKKEYSSNPFTVTAYIQNVGSGSAENTNITLDLPKGMEVVDHYVNIDFGQGAGAISNNDYVDLSIQVYNTGWEHGEYIVENDHSYHTEDTMNMLNTGLAPYNSVVDTRAKRVVWSTRSTREKGGLAPGRVVPRLVTVGNPVASDLYRGGAEHWYEFRTSNGGAYIIDTLGSGYTSGTLYKKKLSGQLERVAFNSGGINFKILTGLEKNTTYYIKVGANTSPALENYILSVRGNEDIMVSTSGGSWMPKMTGFPDPDGPYVHFDKIVYLPKEDISAYYILITMDNYKDFRDKVLSQSFDAAVAYIVPRLGIPAKLAKEFIPIIKDFALPTLTDLELKQIEEAGSMGRDGKFRNGVKITSMTTYRVGINGNIIPMMQNIYTGWDGEIMYGQEYYRGIFSNEKKPMWR